MASSKASNAKSSGPKAACPRPPRSRSATRTHPVNAGSAAAATQRTSDVIADPQSGARAAKDASAYLRGVFALSPPAKRREAFERSRAFP